MRVSVASRVGTTIERLFIKDTYRKDRRSYYICDCSCGTKDFHTRVDAVQSGSTLSCGCWSKENNGMRKHGMYNTRVYKIWNHMIARTTNPKHSAYNDYGGSGICVSDEWRDFNTFYNDIGEPPTTKHSLDRIDGTKGYCKENCRWAVGSIQAKNQKKRNKGKSSSIYKGVTFDKRYRGCWSGGVTKNYTTVRISTGKDELLSAKYFNFMTEYLYGDIVELNPVEHLDLTIEQATELHERIENRFYYDEELKDYVPVNKGEK